jgi:hypothetical protein
MPLNRPTNIAATWAGGRYVTVTWTGPAGAAHIRIYASSDGGATYASIATAPVGPGTVDVEFPGDGVKYIRCTAMDASFANESAQTVEVGVLVNDPGPIPATGIAIDGPASGNVNVAAGPFTISLVPAGSSFTGEVELGMADGGAGGIFAPAVPVLDNSHQSVEFWYIPRNTGLVSLSADCYDTFPNADPAAAFTALAPADDAPQTATGTLIVYDQHGAAAAGVVINFRLTDADGTAARSYPRSAWSATSGANGGVSQVFVRGAIYQANRANGPWVSFTVPDAATFNLPEILGRLGV